jgi:hypothetical protein
MENEIRDILRDILRRGDNILGTTPATDPNCMFLHTLVNYARAKQESEGALARIRDAISIEKDKPRNQVDELDLRVSRANPTKMTRLPAKSTFQRKTRRPILFDRQN